MVLVWLLKPTYSKTNFKDPEGTLEIVLEKLNSLGYPPEGTSTGFQKAKSYVSCAIGKVSK